MAWWTWRSLKRVLTHAGEQQRKNAPRHSPHDERNQDRAQPSRLLRRIRQPGLNNPGDVKLFLRRLVARLFVQRKRARELPLGKLLFNAQSLELPAFLRETARVLARYPRRRGLDLL